MPTPTLPIVEIFRGCQGEQTDIGTPETFVRVAGCNMQCRNCDTKYSWKIDHDKQDTPIDMIAARIEELNIPHVCITGGEPLLYPSEVVALVKLLPDNTFTVQTNGSLWDVDVAANVDHIAMDMKTPCTGEKSKENLIELLDEEDSVKTLIRDQEDYDYAMHINNLIKDMGKGMAPTHILQPCASPDDNLDALLTRLRTLQESVVKDGDRWMNIRVLPQLHVLLYGQRRGV